MISSLPPDQQRMYHLYRYLFTCLAMTRKKDGKPNYKAISDRLSSHTEFRKTVSKLFRWSEPTDDPESPQRPIKLNSIHQATTGEVVSMLVRLQDHLNTDYRKYDDQTPYTRLLNQHDLLTVLQKLIELTPTERNQLGIHSSDALTLLQRAFLTLQQTDRSISHAVALRLYQVAVGLAQDTGNTFQNLEDVDKHIERVVAQALQYLPERHLHSGNGNGKGAETTKIQTMLTRKAQREMRRLLARSGNGSQPIGYRPKGMVTGTIDMETYIRHYLNQAFVTKLAQAVVANERLTKQFPVYLKQVSTQTLGPLPFGDRRLGTLAQDAHYRNLLHPTLQHIDQTFQGELSSPGDYELASQGASEVIVDFYVKVPADYQPSVERVFRQLASQNGDRIDFSVNCTGIGGTLSQAVKIINMTLLTDLPCLQHYFSIAHDVTATQEIIQDNVPSPVWSHNLVKLCWKESVVQALVACQRDRLCSYEQFAFAEPIGQGDYCGFDFFQSQAQAALQARLQAIRHTGIAPKTYLQQLCHHIEQTIALKDAWSYFHGYPFSTWAMVRSIEIELLRPMVGDRPLKTTDPVICFDACLSIIEALLDEGGYRPAKPYLDRIAVLDEFVQEGMAIANSSSIASAQPFTIFSGKLLIRYLICLSHYYYLYDTSDNDPRYVPPLYQTEVNREILVQQAWQWLDQAQIQIQVRLRKYVIIQEVSQATFHPHYLLLSRIAFLRSKLLLFFSRFVPHQETLRTDCFVGRNRSAAAAHWGQLYLIEKARLYAAADGDSEIYACYASMQCWLYLMAAYADSGNLRLELPAISAGQTLTANLASKQCLAWAKTLRDHALISYAKVGRNYYYQIKEKSGLPHHTSSLTQPFGNFSIDRLPAIYEAQGNDYKRLYQQFSQGDDDAWVWDLSLLVVDPADLPKLSPNHPDHPIYLFGTNACYLFFARGMYVLCSDEFTEFTSCQTATGSGANSHGRDDGEGMADLSTNQLARWEEKLNLGMRLLNMAWAIAEEGGKLREEGQSELQENANITLQERHLRITRSIKQGDRPNEYFSPEVNSVRDLYPRRVTEIADWGKVFAAACMVLRLYTVAPEQRDPLVADITTLLNTLHDAYHLTPLSRQLLQGQERYNGHLEPHLNQIKQILLATVEAIQAAEYQVPMEMADDAQATRLTVTETMAQRHPSRSIAHQRQTLLCDIFAVILNHQGANNIGTYQDTNHQGSSPIS